MDILTDMFSKKLKKLRLERGLSQAKLAADIGISDTQYQNYEYGSSVPTLGIIANICKYFDISSDYFFDASDCKNDNHKDLDNIFITRLSGLLKEKEITQAKIAEDLGISRSYISHLFKQESGISVRLLTGFANYLDVSLDYLMGRCDNPNSHKN